MKFQGFNDLIMLKNCNFHVFQVPKIRHYEKNPVGEVSHMSNRKKCFVLWSTYPMATFEGVPNKDHSLTSPPNGGVSRGTGPTKCTNHLYLHYGIFHDSSLLRWFLGKSKVYYMDFFLRLVYLRYFLQEFFFFMELPSWRHPQRPRQVAIFWNICIFVGIFRKMG